VELRVEGDGRLDLGDITQEDPALSSDNWQVPWGEYVLSSDGTSGVPAPFPGPLEITGQARVAFFLHYLDPALPLLTPAGPVPLPSPTPRPARLEFVPYEPPD